jgi:hypothetical protein
VWLLGIFIVSVVSGCGPDKGSGVPLKRLLPTGSRFGDSGGGFWFGVSSVG